MEEKNEASGTAKIEELNNCATCCVPKVGAPLSWDWESEAIVSFAICPHANGGQIGSFWQGPFFLVHPGITSTQHSAGRLVAQ